MSLHPHLLRTDRKPSTAPALMLVGDTFCSLLLDQPGLSIKLGTLSFVSTPNILRNMAEAEQSTSLQESTGDWYIIKIPHTSHVAMVICNCCQCSDVTSYRDEYFLLINFTMCYQVCVISSRQPVCMVLL